ncbi:Hypothetical_protein [Hexamita inflata]|uniref:Hypothetical_protein n=1 Tax=Hexamita inflata TaxID=28002 RepID=A0ABP1HG83_9EUKA
MNYYQNKSVKYQPYLFLNFRFNSYDIVPRSKFKHYTLVLIRQSNTSQFTRSKLRRYASPSHPKDSYKDNFRGHQCQFKCRTNLGCLRRLFRVTILEDEV